jgi:hypothetical protein
MYPSLAIRCASPKNENHLIWTAAASQTRRRFPDMPTKRKEAPNCIVIRRDESNSR